MTLRKLRIAVTRLSAEWRIRRRNLGTPRSKRVELLQQDVRLAQQRVEIAKQLEKVDASDEIQRAKRLQAVD